MGMPSEGTLADATIKTVLREVPVCTLQDDIAAVKTRIPSDWNICVVTDRERIVLGLLEDGIFRHSEETIENVMKPAPLTLRPSVLIADAIAYFRQSDLTFALVTKSTGELMGAIRKSDLDSHKHE